MMTLKTQTPGRFTQREIQIVADVVKQFPEKTQLSIAKINKDKICFHGAVKKASGLIKTNNDSRAVYEIGSITKLFTSSIMLTMAEKGLLDVNRSIDKYLGFELHRGAHISCLELANHTSGLPKIPPGMIWEAVVRNKDNPYKDYDEERLVQYLKTGLKKKKKTRSRYSNLGAGILGYVLEKASGKTYEELLQEYICSPLGMGETSTHRDALRSRLVAGLDKKGRPASNWDLGSLTGAGAILSTVSDLSKYILANFDEQNMVFNQQREATFNVAHGVDIALGWHILRNKLTNGHVWHCHDGGTGGYRSMLVMDAGLSRAVVILSNVSGLHFFKGEKITGLAMSLMTNLDRE